MFAGPIKDVCLGIYDGPHATPQETDSGPIFLGIKNVTEDGRLDFSEVRHVSEQEFPRWTRRVVPKKGDIVFSYEATLHRYALIPDEFRGCLGRRMALVRPDPKKINSQFLHYYFLSPAWKAVMTSNVVTGATVDRIPLVRFPEFPVRVPLLREQKKIAGILSAYDELIENNRRRIALLEESARLLYREWFVHLRFPGHEHVRVVDGVPEGWFWESLGAVAKNYDRMRVPLSSMERSNRNGVYPYYGAAGIIDNIDGYIFDGRYLLMGEDGTVVTSHGSPMLQLVEGKFWVNNHAHVLAGGSVSVEFLYCALSEYKIDGHVTGVAQPKVTQQNMNRIPILIPHESVKSNFENVVDNIFGQKFALERSSRRLREARDLLLPRLMNGEIQV